MGNLIFLILHFLAFAFGMFGLFITIPLHLIYIAAKGKKKKGFIDGFIEGYTTTKCPYCAEMIKEDAVVCKHCKKDLNGALKEEFKWEWNDSFIDKK